MLKVFDKTQKAGTLFRISNVNIRYHFSACHLVRFNSVQGLLQCGNPGPIGSDPVRAAIADRMERILIKMA
jgi:hypothetical protein